MNILFHQDAWKDYQYFQERDVKEVENINKLIKDVARSPFIGIGKPEPLKYSLAGFWSRRIDHEHRLVYQIRGDTIYIAQCRYHY
jgi:toxin YoeB